MSYTSLNASPAVPNLPPFERVIKSREVEDPINLWVHRPFAYAFCWLIYRTRVTPNQVTFLSASLGLIAAACWIEGSRVAMIWGGALLWLASIVDGADGILARAKNIHSAFGRALDGSADMVVGASTVAAAIYHITANGASTGLVVVALAATVATVLQLNLYDFYKELYMRMTRVDRGGEGNTAAEAERLKAASDLRSSPWYTRASVSIYVNYLQVQESLIKTTNPGAFSLLNAGRSSYARAEIYRSINRLPMRFWIAVSLAPHSYLFAIFAMFDRLDVYIVLRVSLMSVLTVAGLYTQRRATARTIKALATLRAR